MKQLILILFLFIPLRLLAPGYPAVTIIEPSPVNPYERIVTAVVQVESKGDCKAYNPIEQARGAFQLRPIKLRDYNNRTGSHYTEADCFNYEISRKIFLYYASQHPADDLKAICISWNGKSKFNKYYGKVKAIL